MKLIYLVMMAVLFASCTKEHPKIDEDVVFNDANWIRLEIKTGKEAHAVFGNLDETLVVSTLTSIFQTVDRGKTWKETKINRQPVYGFLSKQDTVFALMASSQKSQSSQKLSTYASYFTLDYGSTWKNSDEFKVSKSREQEFAVVNLNPQESIKLKSNLEPINGNPDANYVLKSTIEVVRNGISKSLKLPFDNQITNLYLDQKGRLYVSATSAVHDKNTGKYLEFEKTEPAVIYISKQNIRNLID